MNPFDAATVSLAESGLVEASAGTGKTHAITTLFVRLVVEQGRRVDEILVVTFTEAATAELRGRIRGRLATALAAFEARLGRREQGSGDPEMLAYAAAAADPEAASRRLQQALARIDEAAIYTIHGFCHRLLGETALESGTPFELELTTDSHGLRDQVVADFWARSLVDAHPEEVRALRHERVMPSTCRRLAGAVLQRPDLLVRPACALRPPTPDAAKHRARLERLAESYDRSAVEGLLRLAFDTRVLNRAKLKPDQLAGWLDEAEHMIRRRAPLSDFVDSKWVQKLAASHLRAATNKGQQTRTPQHRFFDEVEGLRLAGEDYEAWAEALSLWLRRTLVDRARLDVPQLKEELGVVTFDDLLLSLDAALRGPDGDRLAGLAARRYPVALIDEFQDTDMVQYRIVERIWARGTRLLIGDPKQAIYGFRGADVFAYLKAAEGIPAARRFTMGVNWRSDPSLLRALGQLFGRLSHPFLMPEIDFVDVEARPSAADRFVARSPALGAAPLSFLFAARNEGKKSIAGEAAARLPQAVAREVAELLTGGAAIRDGEEERPVRAGDVAILTRQNREAFAMQRALRREGIVSVVLGDQSVFEADQPEARELALILAAVAEPTRSERLRAALVTELMGLSATDLWAMDRRAEAGEGDTWDRWVDRFRRLQRLWYQRGFIQMITALLQETGMEQRLLSLEGGERRVTNLLHLVELLHRAASTEHLGPAALLHWLATQMDPETAKKRAETTQVRLESDEHAVKITTVHKAKGLEYPIVYLPHLHGGLFGEDRHAVELHEDGVPLVDLAADDDAIARASWEHLAEDARLLYVALTRAKHRLVVVWGGFYGHTTSALGYLLHQPPQPLGAPSVESIAAHLKSLDDRAMRADLGALVAASAGSIEVRELDLEGATAPPGVRVAAPTELESAVLTAREVKTPVVQAFRTASFSELSSGADHDRDHDQAAPRLPPSLAPEGRNKPITLRDFPRGPEAGNFFHELLEHLDFVAGDPAPLIEAGLDAHRFDAALAPVVAQSLDEVLATPIDPGSRRRRFHLRDIPHERRLDELEFFLPVASTVASEQVVPKGTQLALSFDEPGRVKLGPMTAEALARVFADHPSPALDPSYPERVRGLAFIPLEGFLKGYIDLVTEVDGRFYVVDYKTNHLGDDLSDYGPEALRTAMAEGHYYLQAHLYALAVHRFLRRRDRSYRYRDHFGGILYLFLKGMQPGGGGRGVFFEKPPLGRLAALGELLGGGGA